MLGLKEEVSTDSITKLEIIFDVLNTYLKWVDNLINYDRNETNIVLISMIWKTVLLAVNLNYFGYSFLQLFVLDQ